MAYHRGTDLHICPGRDQWAQRRIHPPLIPGHEYCGYVEAVGSEVTSVKEGDFVSAEMHVACGKCLQCRIGEAHICQHVKIIGVDANGAFAEYVVIPETNIWKLDPSIPPEYAPFSIRWAMRCTRFWPATSLPNIVPYRKPKFISFRQRKLDSVFNTVKTVTSSLPAPERFRGYNAIPRDRYVVGHMGALFGKPSEIGPRLERDLVDVPEKSELETLVGGRILRLWRRPLKINGSCRGALVDAGKPKMLVAIAAARELLTILNAILRDKQPWRPEST